MNIYEIILSFFILHAYATWNTDIALLGFWILLGFLQHTTFTLTI